MGSYFGLRRKFVEKWQIHMMSYLQQPISNIAIHQATDRAIPGFAWYNSRGREKNPLSCEWETGL